LIMQKPEPTGLITPAGAEVKYKSRDEGYG
jgi:hypothetical protein